ncbi:hypothetical protein FJ364_05915 [Candidatus Dependentiae bacterium]|nr:hypothetical protein [Candidatus Dependentiae bacterium]
MVLCYKTWCFYHAVELLFFCFSSNTAYPVNILVWWGYLDSPKVSNGKTPSQVDSELINKTPLQEEVSAMYDESKEHIQEANYYLETQLRKLKGSL